MRNEKFHCISGFKGHNYMSDLNSFLIKGIVISRTFILKFSFFITRIVGTSRMMKKYNFQKSMNLINIHNQFNPVCTSVSSPQP